MNKKLQVFVSSTYKDLKEERQAAVEAILSAGHIPAGMELFAAGNESQMETIKRWIDASDIFMLILGGRYGSIDPKSSFSYTELEYDYAISKKKPLFAVVITELAIDKKLDVLRQFAVETDNPQKLKLFRDKVLNCICKFFDEPKDIKLAVHETISDLKNRYEFTGWVSGAEAMESSLVSEEILRLQKHNKELEEELLKLKKNIGKASQVYKGTFKPGDAVQMKSGGPQMTVASTIKDDLTLNDGQVRCNWMNKNELKEGIFFETTLVLYSHGPVMIV